MHYTAKPSTLLVLRPINALVASPASSFPAAHPAPCSLDRAAPSTLENPAFANDLQEAGPPATVSAPRPTHRRR